MKGRDGGVRRRAKRRGIRRIEKALSGPCQQHKNQAPPGGREGTVNQPMGKGGASREKLGRATSDGQRRKKACTRTKPE